VKPLRWNLRRGLREQQVAGASRKPKGGAKGKKPTRPEQNHEATVDEFEREGMGVASKE
jgi:hypothetical protein